MVRLIKTQVALIGGGPACISAAIQLIRSNIEILLISKNIGGNIQNANLIENLLGFPKGISGEEFISLLKEQVMEKKIPILKKNVSEIDRINKIYKIKTNFEEIEAKFVIIGTGTKPIKLGIPDEQNAFQKKKLFYNVYNLIPISINKDVIIIGSGDAAYDYGINLSKEANSISIIQRNATAKCLKILEKRVKKIPNIKILKEKSVEKIRIINDSVELEIKSNELKEIIKTNLVLVAIGRTPKLEFLSNTLKDEFYNQNIERSEKENIYFVGDVKNGNFRQVAIAMGDGVQSAMKIINEISME
ncbi:MAG: NAD(P)/FAD-dependent oxidoreductase [archaeon]|nr:NAD(P)/FAD-dependent oxidoreductase [archaeon]